MLIQMVRNALDIKTIKKMILPPSLLTPPMYYQTSKINLNKEEEVYKKNQRNLSRTNNSLKQLVKIIVIWIIVD